MPTRTFSTTLIITFIIARRSPAAGDDLKRDLAGIPLLFGMRDDLKRDMAQIPLLFVSMLELCWAIAMPPVPHGLRRQRDSLSTPPSKPWSQLAHFQNNNQKSLVRFHQAFSIK